MKRRVVVTGLGVIAPNGIGKDAFWETITSGTSCVRRITRFNPSNHDSQMAAEIDDFNPLEYIDRKDIKRMDRATQFAVAAAKLGIEDAQIQLDREDAERVGIALGMAIGGMDFTETEFTKFINKGFKAVSPYLAIAEFPCSPLGFVSIELGTKGIGTVISTGCAAGADAIGYALNAIRHDDADLMIAGGTEAPIVPLTLHSFCLIRATSRRNNELNKASRPFDHKRDGFVLGEGCGILILEELNHALQRSAPIYAELIGYGTSCDAYHMTASPVDGKQRARAIMLAFEDAGIQPEEVDYISAHGSSTPINDTTETTAIKKAFGEQAYKVAISSIKSMVGHAIGGASGIQAVACALTVAENIIPPTINYQFFDPECDLDYVPNIARQAKVNVAVQNTSGFAGKNSALVMRKYSSVNHP